MTEPFAPDTEAHIASALELVAQIAEAANDLDAYLDAEIAAAKERHPSTLAAYMTATERAALAPVVDLTAHRVVSRAATRRRLL